MRTPNALGAAALALFVVASPALPAPGEHLIISNLNVPNRASLQAGVPYEASINIRTTGPEVRLHQLCFHWNKEGPFCFRQFEMRKGADGEVHPTIGLRTGNPGKYDLSAHMTYWINGKILKTNTTSIEITVR